MPYDDDDEDEDDDDALYKCIHISLSYSILKRKQQSGRPRVGCKQKRWIDHAYLEHLASKRNREKQCVRKEKGSEIFSPCNYLRDI